MIHIFIGTKAQLIKMAPIMRVLQDRSIDYNFIFSGQHKATIDDILNNFSITKKPDITLYEGKDITGIIQMARWGFGIIKNYRSRNNAASLFKNDKNGIVLNHGDTFSTLLGSYLAKKHGLKSAHIESGLRSHNIFHPFPEEVTRLLTFRLSDYFFSPGEWALNNLKKYPGIKINTLQNTLFDSLTFSEKAEKPDITKPYALVSIHRFENIFFKKRLDQIVETLINSDPLLKKVFILHKPTEKKLIEYKLYDKLKSCPHIELHPRYDYFKFISLLKESVYLVTDGGSNQEECSYLGKPCLLMRKATERKEGLDHNVVLSNYDPKIIKHFMSNYQQFEHPQLELKQSPSELIIDSLSDFLD